MIDVGVLLPTSRMFPGAGRGFLAGLEGALAGSATPVRPVVEHTGAGAVRDVVVEKTQKLLVERRPKAVVGVLGAGIEPHVRHLFSEHGTPFLVCNLGGDLLRTGGRPDPYVFCNSLNVWQSMYALGFWASRHVGRTAAVSVAFHEAGYGLGHAFWLGFEVAGGGRVLTTEVTHKESATDDPSDAVARLAEADPDFVVGLYSGREGVSFMAAYAELGLADEVPLVASPMMTHGHWLPRMGPAVVGTRTACSWVPGSHPQEDRRFLQACEDGAARPAPDVFGLLGYEAGLIVRAALDRLGEVPGSGRQLHDAIPGATFASPRGTMAVDAGTGEVATSDHLVRVEADGSDGYRWTGAEPLPLPGRYEADANDVRAQEVKSGWVNPYLVN